MSSSPSADAPDLLVIGHVTEDLINGQGVLGGTATYASLTARNLGYRVALLTSAGWEPGLVDTLQGVCVARLAAEETTRLRTTYRDGRREQRLEALAEPLRYEHLLPEWRAAPLVHLGPVVQEIDPAIVSRFPATAKLLITPQGWLRSWDRRGRLRRLTWQQPEAVLERADVVILSKDDLTNPRQAEQYAARARLLVVTLGQRGARVYERGRRYDSPAFKPRQVVDPTGAGDVFAAAFFLRWHQTDDPRESADFANCVASFAVEQLGPAGVPTRAQVEERWQQGVRLDV